MTSRPRSAMVFAAGFGTRMAPLSDDRPKPLIGVAGRALLDHALALAEEAELDRIVVNAHYRASQIETHLAGRDVAVVIEAPDILDTGGGLKAALPHLGNGPVYTMNTDAVWTGPNPVLTLGAAWDPARMDALLLVVPVDRATGYIGQGDFDLNENGTVERGCGYVYSGVQVISTAGLADISDTVFSLNRLWDRIAAAGRLHAVVHRGGWCDVGRPSGIALAEALLKDPPPLLDREAIR